jgi:sugar phosphate isomerase/epimerase
MALTETIEYDKIEVIGIYKHVQVRKANVIKKDGVELARSFHRYTLDVGTLDPTNNLVDTDLSEQPAEVSTICNAVWTDEVKSLWKAKLIADKSS